MLKKIKTRSTSARGGRFAIVASIYNARYVDSMLRGAKGILKGAKEVRIVRVPGAFEIPVVVAHLIRASKPVYNAVICLGVVLRGETEHAQLISEAVTDSLARLQIDSGVPIIHEVLLLENETQARKRCLSRDHNRGAEAAQTAVAIAKIIRSL